MDSETTVALVSQYMDYLGKGYFGHRSDSPSKYWATGWSADIWSWSLGAPFFAIDWWAAPWASGNGVSKRSSQSPTIDQKPMRQLGKSTPSPYLAYSRHPRQSPHHGRRLEKTRTEQIACSAWGFLVFMCRDSRSYSTVIGSCGIRTPRAGRRSVQKPRGDAPGSHVCVGKSDPC